MELFNPEQFASSGIRLNFLRPEDIVYRRRGEFIPWLSIIDVLMFNGLGGTNELLKRYALEPPELEPGATVEGVTRMDIHRQ
jgi:hypothetical protein